MDDFKEQVKKWLSDNGKDRFWLATECYVSKDAVDKWLSTKGKIPAIKKTFIQNLMDKKKNISVNKSSVRASIVFDVSEEMYDLFENASFKAGMKLRDYLVYLLEYAARHPEFEDKLLDNLQEKRELARKRDTGEVNSILRSGSDEDRSEGQCPRLDEDYYIAGTGLRELPEESRLGGA